MSACDALVKAFKDFQEALDKNVKSFNDLQREKFGQLEDKQNKLVEGTEKKLESIRVTVEEKLEKTLSERLGQSFETVGKQLIGVQKSLGRNAKPCTGCWRIEKSFEKCKNERRHWRGAIGNVA